MESTLGRRVISTFPVGSGTGGKWDQLGGWGRGGRRWRRAGPGDGLPDGEGKTSFSVFLVTGLLTALVVVMYTCPVLE